MKTVGQGLRFIGTLIKLKFERLLVFRFSFFGCLLIDLTYFLFQLLMFEVIYTQVDRIGGWGRGEMLLFVGTFSMITSINMTLFFFGIDALPEKIQRGTLDAYLTAPVSPLLRLSFENVNPAGIPMMALSLFVILWGASQMDGIITPALWILYAVYVLLMTLLFYDLQLILRCIPFFVISANSIDQTEGIVMEPCLRIPGVLFKGFFRFLFCMLLPYGLMATLPVEILNRAVSPAGLIYGAVVTAAFTGFALWFWRFGLRHYKSAGI